MQQGQIGIIERAFQIARAGNCICVSEITTALIKEGYENAGSHLTGQMINRQLRAEIASSRRTKSA